MRPAYYLLILFLGLYACSNGQEMKEEQTNPEYEGETINKTDNEWREELDELTYHVTREKGTERAFTGPYDKFYEEGSYSCSNCGLELFSSEHKFDSGSGWPSFYTYSGKGHVTEIEDRSFGMVRAEVVCSRCKAHLGHVFDDGPKPTGLRYCINSASLKFQAEEK